MSATTISDRTAELLRVLVERANELGRVAIECDDLAALLGVDPWRVVLGVSIVYGAGQLTDAMWLVHADGVRLVAALASGERGAR
ncbi:hypothetical protein IF188_08050 [Microbacterium sp. NEAU-LLC]|uniref:Uncharacterized protein n=1 Tax=Microbacterium helvum TaxID=2773713 RepID=A0ABR8NLV0_9MICO|nr:hypothetical protein [Microbacterium helvum]MBD3941645.1 hypothetical protein [Microbacterium helvum]